MNLQAGGGREGGRFVSLSVTFQGGIFDCTFRWSGSAFLLFEGAVAPEINPAICGNLSEKLQNVQC